MPRPLAPRRRSTARVTLVAVTAVWGVTFPLNAVALRTVSAPTLTLARFVLATVVIAVIARVRGLRLAPSGRELWVGAVTGGLLFGGYLTQIEGQRFVAPALAGFLTGLSVVLVPLLLLLLGQRPTAPQMLGTGLALVGLVLLTNPDGGGSLLGEGLVLACALCFALQLVALEQIGGGLDPLRLTFWQMAMVAAASVVACVGLGAPLAPLHASSEAWLTIALDGVLASALAFFAQTWALRHLESIEVAVIYVLEPVFAAFAALIGLGDHQEALVWLGGAAVVGAMALVALGGERDRAGGDGRRHEAAG
jgi:drug/metabolite transporter (DMT)-like permease